SRREYPAASITAPPILRAISDKGIDMAQIAQILAASLLLVLGLFVLRAQPRRTANRAFAAQTLLIGGWVLSIIVLHTGSHPGLWSGVSFASAAMIPSAFFYFTSVYPTIE